ncbi:MAG TPA: DUF4215 domain-containing protein, partial [Polyangiaceae bacterium]|nr:DUF4215 domain-containing protein [Polyangiaceae bacterium]
SGGKGGKGGSTNQGGANEGGMSDVGGGAAEGGSGGVPASCGDGMVAPDEECDGDNLLDATCESLGFTDGTLACSANCSLDTSDCSGSENCGDGADNDGDMLVDCEDDDCEESCADPCAAPEVLADPAEIMATTAGRADAVSSDCSASSPTPGPDVVYAFEASTTGMLEIVLESTQLMQVSVLDACSGSAATVACDDQFLSLPVTAGDSLLIAVEAYEPGEAGPFVLNVKSRALDVCGDGYRDASEECDDGDTDALDGCDSDCNLETSEGGSNDTTAEADSLMAPYYGTIAPQGDVDVIELAVPSGPASIVANINAFGDDCLTGELDSLVELIDSTDAVIASDDDSGVNFCSHLVSSGLTAGTYYLRVSAAPTGATPTFPYQLSVEVNVCGDGLQGPGEQCDDGDQTPGDGCDASCQLE